MYVLTRKADTKATGSFSIKARDESEKQVIHKLKKLAVQDELDLADLVFEGLDLMLKAHHYDTFPNPQLQLTKFSQDNLLPKEPLICENVNCKAKVDHLTECLCISGVKLKFCDKCVKEKTGRTIKKVLRVVKKID